MKLFAAVALAAVTMAGFAQPAEAYKYSRRVHGPVRLLPHHRVKHCEVRIVAHHRVKKCNFH